METAIQLAKRFSEVILNGTWIANTNFKDQLTGTDWHLATAKIGELNTIADLTSHIHYYIAGLIRFFEDGKLDISDQYSFDFPPVQSQKDWDEILNQFWMYAEKFIHLITSFSNEKLQEVFVDIKYGNYQRNIEGMIEHSYYHLGQIVLIKKIITSFNQE